MRALALFLFAFATACGGASKFVHSSLATAARGVQAADQLVAGRYEAAAHTNLEVADTLEEYRSLMVKYDRAEEALRTAREALVAAELVADDVDAGQSGSGPVEIACAVSALMHLSSVLTAIGVEVPREIKTAIEVIGPIAAEACRVEQ